MYQNLNKQIIWERLRLALENYTKALDGFATKQEINQLAAEVAKYEALLAEAEKVSK